MSLREILAEVIQRGRIDLAVLVQDSVHLLPPPREAKQYYFPARQADEWVKMGFISVEQAAGHLSHRQAFRKGDDIIIWSLLVDTKAHDSALSFWKARISSQLGASIYTGYIFSSVPRVQGVKGLSWAPASPTCNRLSTQFFPTDQGQFTKRALIHHTGLLGDFAINIFHYDAGAGSDQYQRKVIDILRSTSQQTYHWLALVHPLIGNELYQKSTAYRYRGKSSGSPLFGICVSNDIKDKKIWIWKAVYEWNAGHKLPEFHEREITLV
jgi:hypothetical protein